MNGLHLTRLPAQVNGNDNFRQFSIFLCIDQFRSESLNTHVVSAWVDVDKINISPAISRAIGTGNKGNGRGPYRITDPHAERKAGNVKRAGRAVDGRSVPNAAIVGNRLLESGHNRALRQELRMQNIHYRLDVIFGNILPPIWNHAHQNTPE